MSSRRSGSPRLLLLITIQVVATLLLFEITLRLIRPHHNGLASLLYLPSLSTNLSKVDNTADLLAKAPKNLVAGQTSGGFVLNSRGLRTHEYVYERGGGLRIVAIGDSFTWGAVPHRDTWPVRLGAILRRTLSREDVEVISLGVPGVGPRYYLRLWELEGRRLQPDLVILGFFVGNDLTDEAGVRPTAARHGWLVEHSLAVRAVRNGIRVATSGMRAERDDGEILKDDRAVLEGRMGYEIPGYADSFDPAKGTISEPAFLRIEWDRMAICLDGNRPMLQKLLKRVGPVLIEFDRSVRAAGAELLIFLIPDEYQVNDQLSARLLETHDTDPSEFVRKLPQRKLVAILEEAEIHHIDGLRRIRARNAAEGLYLPRDTHWNAAGNQLAARMMVDYLLNSGLVAAPETRP